MYLYGISIGMNFKDIANILMSDTAKTLTSVLNSNVFTDNSQNSRLSSVFRYFDQRPSRQLNKFSNKVTNPFKEAFLHAHPTKDTSKADNNLLTSLVEWTQSGYTLSTKLAELESYRKLYGKDLVVQGNQLIDFLEDYTIQAHTIGNNKSVYNDIKNLQAGAEEFRILGQILSLNQGLKTNAEDLFKQINNIELSIYNRKRELKAYYGRDYNDTANLNSDKIDLIKFITDKAYQQDCINRYDAVKHSFNILEAAIKVPHIKGYVESLAIALNQLNRSYKFRSTRDLSLQYTSDLKYMDSYKVARGIQRYINNKTIKEWMRNQEIKVLIPKGNKYFDKYGNTHVFDKDTEIQLGNDWNNATFRMFMERQVIPDLKKGIYKNGSDRVVGSIASNKFIKDLSSDIITTTVLGNSSILYTLPINMLPRTDIERSLLNQYKGEFNKLSQYVYIIDNTKLPLVEAFTYYAMISNEWRLGEKSLVPILEDFQNTGVLKDFHDFEAALDRSDRVLTKEEIDFNELLPYIINSDSPYSSSSKYISYRNPVTHKRMIMKKRAEQKRNNYSEYEEEDYIQEMIGEDFTDLYGEDRSKSIGEYDFIPSIENTNYFPSGYIQNQEYQQVSGTYTDQTGESISWSVDYDINTGEITNSTSKSLIGTKMPFKKVDGFKVPNSKLLESIIKNLENPC